MNRKLRGEEVPLILFALFIDLVLNPAFTWLSGGALGFVGDLVAAFAYKHWLERYGVELYGDKNKRASWIVTVLEFFPWVNLLPLWTFRIGTLLTRDALGYGV